MDKRNILSFLWQHGKEYGKMMKVLGKSELLIAYGGEDVSVISKDKGSYEFKAAEVIVDGRCYKGTVKIFEKLSEWYYFKKRYEEEAARFAIVIIENADSYISLMSGDEVIIQITIPDDLLDKYLVAVVSNGKICREYFSKISDYRRFEILDRLMASRIEQKCKQINVKYNLFDDWDKTFQYYLFDTIDIAGHNRDNFNELAKRVGVDVIISNLSTIEEVEALLFGVAGLLMTDDNKCDYLERLKSLYVPLRGNYHLVEMNRTDWFFRSKGRNISLHIEIARLAALLFAKISFRELLFDESNRKNIYKIMRHDVSPFWRKHIVFSDREQTMERDCVMTDEKIDIFIINVIIPMSYAMSLSLSGEVPDKDSSRLSVLLESIKGEKNRITNEWSSEGFEIKTALDSQAIIHLQKNYCNITNCGNCPIFVRM